MEDEGFNTEIAEKEPRDRREKNSVEHGDPSSLQKLGEFAAESGGPSYLRTSEPPHSKVS